MLMRRFVLVSLVLAVGLLMVPTSSSAANLTTYVGCSDSFTAVPSHVCQLGDEPGAFFESDEELEYEVCVEFPNGEEICLEELEVEAETLDVITIVSEEPGNHLVTWWVEGLEVDSWAFSLDPPPAPAPPPPPAAAPPAAVPPAPSAKCNKAKSRVNGLKARLRKATTHKQKVRIRANLKSARAAVRNACA
jgi:hypothetical protein